MSIPPNFRINNDLYFYAITAYIKAATIGVVPAVEPSIQAAINKGARRILITSSFVEPATLSLRCDLLIEINSGVTLTFCPDTQIDLNGYCLTIVGMGGCSLTRSSVMSFSQVASPLFTTSVSGAFLLLRDLVISQDSPSGGDNTRGLVDNTVELEIQSSCIHITQAATGGDKGYVVCGGTGAITNITITDVSFDYDNTGVGPIITGGNCTSVTCTDITFEGGRPTTFCDVNGGLFCDDMTDTCTGGTNIQLLGNNVYENCGNHGGTAFDVNCDGPTGASGDIEISNCKLSAFNCDSKVNVNVQMNQCSISGNCNLYSTDNKNCTADISNVQITGTCGLANSTGTNNIKCTNVKVTGACTGGNTTGTDTIQLSNCEFAAACTFGGVDTSGSTKVICSNVKCGSTFTLDKGCDSSQINNLTCTSNLVVNDCASVFLNNCQSTGGDLSVNATGNNQCNDFRASNCQFNGNIDINASTGTTQVGLKLSNCEAEGGSGIDIENKYTSFCITGCLSGAGISCTGTNGLISSCQTTGATNITTNATAAVVGCRAAAVSGAGNVAANYS